MEFDGLPLHPLVVHAAVVFVPFAAIAMAVYAVVPRWRWLLRWPMLVLGLVAAGTVQVAVMSGEDLKSDLGITGRLIDTHEMWAGRLRIATFVLAALVVVAWWVLPVVTPLPGRSDRAARVAAVRPVVVVVLPLMALVELFLVFKTGDSGARAVWSGVRA